MKLKELLAQLRTTTIITVEPKSRSGYYVYKKSVSWALDWTKLETLNFEIEEKFEIFSDYGIVIRVKDGSLKNESKDD